TDEDARLPDVFAREGGEQRTEGGRDARSIREHLTEGLRLDRDHEVEVAELVHRAREVRPAGGHAYEPRVFSQTAESRAEETFVNLRQGHGPAQSDPRPAPLDDRGAGATNSRVRTVSHGGSVARQTE